jgi:transcriptional regulator
MYNPPLFVESRDEVLWQLIRSHPLATLLSVENGEIEGTHLPMFLDAEKNTLRAHLARANSHWQKLDGKVALAIFHGPEHYISPSWYPSKTEHGKVVPTWNYTVVHIRGVVSVHHDAEFIHANVTELTAHNEARIGSDWKVSDAPEDFIRAQIRAIVGIELAIQSVEGKLKLSQNRLPADREGVIQKLDALATDTSLAMSRLMRR